MRPRIFLIGSGVGKVRRGFESHIQDLFNHIKDQTGYETYLIKGAGAKIEHEIPVRSISAKSLLSKFLGSLLRRNAYVIQQLNFFLSIRSVIKDYQPDVLYLGEPVLFNYLYRWRRSSGMKFKMIFFTGGNTVPLKMDENDFLQLVTPTLLPFALSRGIQQNQIQAIPHFIDAPIKLETSKKAFREKYGISDQLIILSVGAIDASVKRMDYLINEVSKLTRPYFLMIIGEHERESPGIIKLATEKLSANSFYIGSVPRNELGSFYSHADLFVLASLNEGFGLVTIEALQHGLPVLVHPHANAQFVLGENACYADLSQNGNLTRLIEDVVPSIGDEQASLKRKSYALKFSWQALENEYLELFFHSIQNSTNQKTIG